MQALIIDLYFVYLVIPLVIWLSGDLCGYFIGLWYN